VCARCARCWWQPRGRRSRGRKRYGHHVLYEQRCQYGTQVVKVPGGPIERPRQLGNDCGLAGIDSEGSEASDAPGRSCVGCGVTAEPARDGAAWRSIELPDTDLSVSSFGEDEAGEVYVVDLKGGVYRVAAGWRTYIPLAWYLLMSPSMSS